MTNHELEPPPITDARDAFRWLVVTNVLLFLVVVGLGLTGWLVIHNEIEANRKSRVVQCLQRARLDVQIRRTREVLRENPGPIVFAIPRDLLVDGLKDNLADRKALSILACPPEETQ